MDSTIITIIIAIAIMGFQIYSEKKKKENTRARAMGIKPDQQPYEDPREKLQKELSSLFAGFEKEEEESTPYDIYTEESDNEPLDSAGHYYSEDPFESIIREPEVVLDTLPEKEGESLLQKPVADIPVKSEKIDVTGSIYDSKAISDHENAGAEVKHALSGGGEFDPRMFIIYSELANPKFRD